MPYDPNKINYQSFKTSGTGDHPELEEGKIAIIPFDKYEIKVLLSPSGELIEVLEIKIRKSFLSERAESSPKGFHDVSKFYDY